MKGLLLVFALLFFTASTPQPVQPDFDAVVYIFDVQDYQADGFTFTHHSEVIYDAQVLTGSEVVAIMKNYIEWYEEVHVKKRKTKKL